MENKLEDLLGDISSETDKYFKARCFMTEKAETEIFDEKKEIDSLRIYCKQNNYDIALIKRKNNEIAYIKLIDMENENCKNIIDIINTISREKRININTPIPELLDKFEELKYVFVYDGDIFKGIITLADLNKPSLYTYSYILISDFEKLLRNIVRISCREEEWLEHLSDENQKQVGGNFIANKAKGIETSLLECTTITQLKEVLLKSKLYNEFKVYNGQKEYNKKLKEIIDYRNAVMHNRNLIRSEKKYDEFYKFLLDFCMQRKAINEYYESIKEDKESTK
mgnify:CR=1 FL=1